MPRRRTPLRARAIARRPELRLALFIALALLACLAVPGFLVRG